MGLDVVFLAMGLKGFVRFYPDYQQPAKAAPAVRGESGKCRLATRRWIQLIQRLLFILGFVFLPWLFCEPVTRLFRTMMPQPLSDG
jgi:hypothetical protein